MSYSYDSGNFFNFLFSSLNQPEVLFKLLRSFQKRNILNQKEKFYIRYAIWRVFTPYQFRSL